MGQGLPLSSSLESDHDSKESPESKFSILKREQLVDARPHRLRNLMRHVQGRVVLPLLDEQDSLPPDPDLLRKVLLGQAVPRAQLLDPGLHRSAFMPFLL